MADAPPSARPTGGIVLGRPFGVPVIVDWSWFFACGFLALLFAPRFAASLPGLTPTLSFAVAVSFGVLLGLSILAHELAHMATALALHRRVTRVVVHFLGGQTEFAGDDTRPGSDFLIAAAGPAASLLLAGLGFLAARSLPDDTALGVVTAQLAITNLIVGIFNLLPGLPLDGGQLLRDVIWAVTKRELVATRIAAWVGRGFAVLLTLWAVLGLGTQGAFGSGLWLLFIAAFMWINAGRVLSSVQLRSQLPQLQTALLTRRAIPVAPDLPVSEALRHLHAAGARALVVVDGEGRARGIVAEAAVAALPEQRRPWVSVSSVARQLGPDTTLPVDLGGLDLLQRMDGSTASEYLVVDRAGAIVGVLARADVESAVGRLGMGHQGVRR